ncbi:hypothetical protein BC834DRAFT_1044165 [Gloeopeniophorella convolvens]|nr:hypothetical protein BC834DRAFT_1044165 [Gloeopeniophorella convolvens]
MVRFKNRWLLVEFLPTSPPATDLTAKDLLTALRTNTLVHFGDAGWGLLGASLSVKYFAPATRLAIVRVARAAVRTAHAALALLSVLGGARVVPHVLRVSGPGAGGAARAAQLEASTREIEALQD